MSTDDKKPSDNNDFVFPPIHETEEPVSPPPAPVITEVKEEVKKPEEPVQPSSGKVGKIRALFQKNKNVSYAIIFVLLAGLVWGVNVWRQKEQATEEGAGGPKDPLDEIPVNVVEVHTGQFRDEISATGELKGEVEIELRFEVDGTIQEFKPLNGSTVKRGQIIARLNDGDAYNKVKRARIELEQNEKLFSLGGISRTKLEEARLNLDVAQSELDKTRIVAKIDGVIGDKATDVGEFVTPQRKIATLASIKNVMVKVGIIDRQIDKVFPGQKILVTVDSFPGNIFEGNIASVSPFFEGRANTAEASATIPNNDNLLLPGMFARARIITYEVNDAITVPNDALVKTSGGWQVFVVNKDGVAESKDVDAGYIATEYTQILTGLTAGELVIVQRPPELKAGSKVKVIETNKPAG